MQRSTTSGGQYQIHVLGNTAVEQLAERDADLATTSQRSFEFPAVFD
jgi:hypothetical protein